MVLPKDAAGRFRLIRSLCTTAGEFSRLGPGSALRIPHSEARCRPGEIALHPEYRVVAYQGYDVRDWSGVENGRPLTPTLQCPVVYVPGKLGSWGGYHCPSRPTRAKPRKKNATRPAWLKITTHRRILPCSFSLFIKRNFKNCRVIAGQHHMVPFYTIARRKYGAAKK